MPKKKISQSAIKQHLRSTIPSRGRLHVASKGSEWSVRREGATKGRVFSNKNEAVSYAEKRSRNKSRNIIVHRRDGTVERWR